MTEIQNDREIQKIIRKRLRQYGEPMATSPQLRESLSDEQANELVDWGMKVLKQAVEETAVQPDSQVHVALDLKATTITLIMTLVNQLVEHPGPLPDEDIINSRLQRLGKNLFWITENQNRKLHSERINAYKNIRDSEDSTIIFQHLMSIIYGYYEEESTI